MTTRLLLAEGGPLDMANQELFRSLDEALAEGDRTEWLFYLRLPPPADAVQALYNSLVSQGVTLWGGGVSVQEDNTLVVQAEKRLAPLTIIALAIAAAVVIVAIMVSWSIYQMVGGASNLWLLLVGAGALLALGLVVGGSGKEEYMMVRR